MTTTSATSPNSVNVQSLMSAAGSATGIDVNSLVTQLVAADKAIPQQQITDRQTEVNTEISALAALKSAIGAFQSTLQNLGTSGTFAPRTATSSDETIVTASAGGSAATGSYGIEVDALASAHQLSSSALAGGSGATVGTGTLSITSGSHTFSVTIDSTNDTLQGIADAINSASGNTSVQASVLNEQNGSHLVLTATQTGAANAITVKETDAGSGLSQLIYDPSSGTTNLSVLQDAQDSHIKIAGYDHYSPTNTVTDAITGLTLNLQSAKEGTTVTVNVENDNQTLQSNVQRFVTAYNSMITQVNTLDSYNASTQTAGPLFGDVVVSSTLSGIGNDVTNAVSGISGAYNSLASLGITTQADGTIGLDQAKFDAAVAAAPGSVAAVFGSADGVVARASSHLTSILAGGSVLDTRNQQLQSNLQQIDDDQSALDARMDALTTQYTNQFTALNTLLSQLQSTSSYLTQAFANLPKPNSISKNS